MRIIFTLSTLERPLCFDFSEVCTLSPLLQHPFSRVHVQLQHVQHPGVLLRSSNELLHINMTCGKKIKELKIRWEEFDLHRNCDMRLNAYHPHHCLRPVIVGPQPHLLSAVSHSGLSLYLSLSDRCSRKEKGKICFWEACFSIKMLHCVMRSVPGKYWNLFRAVMY